MLRDRQLARLRPLLKGKEGTPGDAIEPLARAMQGLAGKGRIRVTCLGGNRPTSWTVTHQGGKAAVDRRGGSKPGAATLEMMATDATLRAILAGELSPLEAFAQNRLRFRGNPDYARLVLRHLAQRPEMSTEICD
jgi:hypothetical protein